MITSCNHDDYPITGGAGTSLTVLVYGHFGIGAEVSVDTSAPVPKCLGHFGTDHRGSHACQRQQLCYGVNV